MCDLPKTFQAYTRRARKAHRCIECSATIKPGDEYEFASGVWEDGPATFKTCATCAADRKAFLAWLWQQDPWEDCAGGFGHLREDMSDWGFEPPSRETQEAQP